MRTDRPKLRFGRLTDASHADIIRLMNDPSVGEHLPLLRSLFDDAMCSRFVESKERMWTEVGFGPWAFFRGDEFVGWGGLQPEGDEVDVGMILSPDAWGYGASILRRSLALAFDELERTSVIALLPQSRTRLRALRRIGFREDGSLDVGGTTFHQFRLTAEQWAQGTVRGLDQAS